MVGSHWERPWWDPVRQSFILFNWLDKSSLTFEKTICCSQSVVLNVNFISNILSDIPRVTFDRISRQPLGTGKLNIKLSTTHPRTVGNIRKIRSLCLIQEWWQMPIIPALKERVQGLSELHSKYQVTQGYIAWLCLGSFKRLRNKESKDWY